LIISTHFFALVTKALSGITVLLGLKAHIIGYKPFQGKFPCIDSAPIDVVTLGVPQSIASTSFPLIPAPKRNGARTTLAC
jgi:hypothetical protein